MSVLSLQRLKTAFSYFPQILKQSAVIFIVLQAINFFFNQIMIYLQEVRMTSKEDFYVPVIILLAVLGFFVQSAVKVLWVLVVCRFFQKQNDLSSYLKRHLEQGVIESLRAFLKIVLNTFLLIIPGVIKMIRYQFVIFIVALEDQYERGNLDALKTSENLSKGKTFPLLMLVIIFAILSVFTTSNQLVVNAPVSNFFIEVFAIALTTFECIYIYLLYMDLKNNKGLQT